MTLTRKEGKVRELRLWVTGIRSWKKNHLLCKVNPGVRCWDSCKKKTYNRDITKMIWVWGELPVIAEDIILLMFTNKKSLLTIVLVKLLYVAIFVPTNQGCCHKIKNVT